jgi:hypothetical protein
LISEKSGKVVLSTGGGEIAAARAVPTPAASSTAVLPMAPDRIKPRRPNRLDVSVMFRSPFLLSRYPGIAIPVEDRVQELPGAWAPRIREDHGRGTLLYDAARIHEHDAIGYFAREIHLVRDHDHRHSLTRELPHHAQYIAHQLGVE